MLPRGLARSLAGMVCGSVLAFAPYARAQASDTRVPTNGSNGDGLDTHLFRPAVDSKGFFSVNGTDVIGHNDFSFGMTLDWGHTLMRTAEPDALECATTKMSAFQQRAVRAIKRSLLTRLPGH
jgi:OmpA-OmpF porin, OOP family